MANKKASATTDNGKTLTEYIVLERRSLRGDGETKEILAWVPVPDEDLAPKVFSAAGKTQAIRQHTGEGADVIEGTWKAVPLSSFRGGETTKRVTASERLPFEEALA